MVAKKSTRPEVFAFRHTAELARASAGRLGLECRPVHVHRFPDGESLVRIESEGAAQAFVFCSLDHPNEKLVEVLLAADAVRRRGAAEVVLVAPYLGYMRQDRVFHAGEPISQRVIARMLDAAFDQVITVEAHLHRISRLSEVFSCRADSFSAAAPIAAWLRSQDTPDLLVGPDAESEPWIRDLAGRAGLPWVVGKKTRYADAQVEIDLPETAPNARSAWIIDDIASSGATLETVARVLARRGFDQIGAIVVHALFAPETLDRLSAAGLDRVVSTDSIRHPTNEISLAELIATTIDSRIPCKEAP